MKTMREHYKAVARQSNTCAIDFKLNLVEFDTDPLRFINQYNKPHGINSNVRDDNIVSITPRTNNTKHYDDAAVKRPTGTEIITLQLFEQDPQLMAIANKTAARSKASFQNKTSFITEHKNKVKNKHECKDNNNKIKAVLSKLFTKK